MFGSNRLSPLSLHLYLHAHKCSMAWPEDIFYYSLFWVRCLSFDIICLEAIQMPLICKKNSIASNYYCCHVYLILVKARLTLDKADCSSKDSQMLAKWAGWGDTDGR